MLTQKKKNDCWKLVQDIYRDEHNINLPDIPIIECAESFLTANIKHKIVDKPSKGVIVHCSRGKLEHTGYAINEKQYIHKTINNGVIVSNIPKDAVFYEIIS